MTLLREALFREESALFDNDASNQADDADAALQELGADAVAAGYTTLTITLAEESEEALKENIERVRQVSDGMGFVTEGEGSTRSKPGSAVCLGKLMSMRAGRSS
jgi:type IV secretion system protein VirB4